MTRIERLAALLEQPLLVAGPPYVQGGQANVRYLTGLDSSNAALLVEPDASATLFADFRYAARARAGRGRRRSSETQRNLLAGRRGAPGRTPDRVRGGAPAVRRVPAPRGGGRRRRADGRPRRVAPRGEGRGRARDHAPRRGALGRGLRGARAGALLRADRARARVVGRAFVPRCRRGRRLVLRRSSRRERPARRRTRLPADPIAEGVLVIVDAGCIVDGYCSDCTRTFAVGEISERLHGALRAVPRGAARGLAAVGPGVSGRDADAASRVAIAAAGLGEAFGHGLGHGVGIQIHEAPSLRPESTDVLEPGNVVSVEPGHLPPGRGRRPNRGSRLVTEDGAERLTQFTKELVTVD